MIKLSEYEQQTLDQLKEGHTSEEQRKIENRFMMIVKMMRNSVWGHNVVPVSYTNVAVFSGCQKLI